jgi:hypothetical protein
VKKGGETGLGVLPRWHRCGLFGGTATPRAVPTRPRFRAAEVEVVTAGDGVHHHDVGGAPPSVVRWHRRFLAKSKGRGLGHRLGTAMPRAVHCPIFPESRVFAGLAWVVTATPSGDQWSHWNLTIGRGTAMSGARHRRVWCPRRNQQLCSNDSIWLGGYK